MDNRTITPDQARALAANYGVEYAALTAVITVESSGVGFNPPTGKLIIRFEPTWFERLSKVACQHLSEEWNGAAGNQAAEYALFNSAFAIDAIAAMEATSVGMMQVMGFHYQELGFATVGDLWDFAKVNEVNQVELGLRFIKYIPALLAALKIKDWSTFAYHYNGANYRENNYDQRLLTAYNKWQ
jgi:hypothetical protein